MAEFAPSGFATVYYIIRYTWYYHVGQCVVWQIILHVHCIL